MAGRDICKDNWQTVMSIVMKWKLKSHLFWTTWYFRESHNERYRFQRSFLFLSRFTLATDHAIRGMIWKQMNILNSPQHIRKVPKQKHINYNYKFVQGMTVAGKRWGLRNHWTFFTRTDGQTHTSPPPTPRTQAGSRLQTHTPRTQASSHCNLIVSRCLHLPLCFLSSTHPSLLLAPLSFSHSCLPCSLTLEKGTRKIASKTGRRTHLKSTSKCYYP